jgi:predicted transposase YbfD/YdcC
LYPGLTAVAATATQSHLELLGVIAIDGKTVRRSGHKTSGKAAIHMVVDYVLALKGNQGSLREDVKFFVAEQETDPRCRMAARGP